MSKNELESFKLVTIQEMKKEPNFLILQSWRKSHFAEERALKGEPVDLYFRYDSANNFLSWLR